MATWSDFHQYILLETPGLPVPILDHVLRKAAIEFCEETSIHVIDTAAINVVAGTSEYAIPTGSTDLDCCQVKFAWLEDRPLPFISQETLNNLTGAYWPGQTAQRPTGFTQQDQNHIILYPSPTESITGGLRLKIVVRPSITAGTIEDWIVSRFVQEISYGALAMLTGMPGKPWTHLAAEEKYRSLFEAAKTKATIDSYRSFTRASLQISLPRY